MFCSNCGKKLEEGAKFCSSCGTKVGEVPPVEPTPTTKESKRTSNDGSVFKCPNCGEVLPFDAVKCPTCGYEIRGRQATLSLNQFFEKIENVSNDDRRIEIINTYPIPNNKEDIFEFMILATSIYDSTYGMGKKPIDDLAYAWISKIEQCFQKGKMLFTDKKDLEHLEEIYGVKRRVVATPNRSGAMIGWGIVLIILAAMFFVISISTLIYSGDSDILSGSVSMMLMGFAMLAGGILLLVFGKIKRRRGTTQTQVVTHYSRLEEAKKLAIQQEADRNRQMKELEKQKARDAQVEMRNQIRQKAEEAKIETRKEERLRAVDAKLNAKYKK